MSRQEAMEAAAKRLRGQTPLELGGDVRATFPGYGLIEFRWEDGWMTLHTSDLDAVVERANDLYGVGEGVPPVEGGDGCIRLYAVRVDDRQPWQRPWLWDHIRNETWTTRDRSEADELARSVPNASISVVSVTAELREDCDGQSEGS